MTTDAFTAANGTALDTYDPRYVVSNNAAGSALTIESNQLRSRTTIGAYGGNTRWSRADIALKDIDVTGKWTAPASILEQFPGFYLRGTAAWVGTSDGPS